MSNVTCEIFWARDLLAEHECPMRLYYDNCTANHITENLVYHECIKHIEVNYHLVRQKIKEKIVQARHVSSVISWQIYKQSILRRHELDFIMTSWAYIMYMLQLEGSVIKNHYVFNSHYVIRSSYLIKSYIATQY